MRISDTLAGKLPVAPGGDAVLHIVQVAETPEE